jgi:predicted ferric reductase
MKEKDFDISSRISSKAIIASIFSVFSLMILFMLLASGLKLWAFNLQELDYLERNFWVWTGIAWLMSLTLSSYLSILIGRVKDWMDGLIYGFITWASSTVLACLFLVFHTGKLLGRDVSQAFIWSVFIGNIAAIALCLYTSYKATQKEEWIERLQDIREVYRKQRKFKTTHGRV